MMNFDVVLLSQNGDDVRETDFIAANDVLSTVTCFFSLWCCSVSIIHIHVIYCVHVHVITIPLIQGLTLTGSSHFVLDHCLYTLCSHIIIMFNGRKGMLVY